MLRNPLFLVCIAMGHWQFAISTANADHASKLFDETSAITLFAFDDISIPFTQNLRLRMQSPRRHPSNPVLARGQDGAVDSWAVQFYGSVLRDDATGKYRMWYVAVSKEERRTAKDRSAPWRVAYAESDDGIVWRKPHLNLTPVQAAGNNNLGRLDPPLGVINLKVMHEPQDADPNQRFKMAAHVWFPKNDVRLGTLATYVSPDGLAWTMVKPIKPVRAELPVKDALIPALHFEPVGGFYKWDGLYHVSGQNAISATRPYHGRVSRTIVSPDFRSWTAASAIQFVRPQQHRLLGAGRSLEGEQTHEGISVWNRGNVLLGISGMWHGAPQWDDVTIDLGFLLSNDGIHFREPAHEHLFLRRGADGQWDQGGLLQGQGFANVDDETRIYYGAWDPRHSAKSPPRGGVGIAVLPRDRFADLSVDKTTEGDGNYQIPRTSSNFITKSIPWEAGKLPKFFINAHGLGEDAVLKIELLSHRLEPLPGYSGNQAAQVDKNGFQTPVHWKTRNPQDQDSAQLPRRFRIKASFIGKHQTKIRFCALYVR